MEGRSSLSLHRDPESSEGEGGDTGPVGDAVSSKGEAAVGWAGRGLAWPSLGLGPRPSLSLCPSSLRAETSTGFSVRGKDGPRRARLAGAAPASSRRGADGATACSATARRPNGASPTLDDGLGSASPSMRWKTSAALPLHETSSSFGSFTLGGYGMTRTARPRASSFSRRATEAPAPRRPRRGPG